MTVLVTGSSGLVGSALVSSLRDSGHKVRRLVRAGSKANSDVACWDPKGERIDPGSFRETDAVVHLAGENIAAGRWTSEQKARIRDSRVKGTRLISEALATLTDRPAVLVCASAIGFYGDRGDEPVNEASLAGRGFLADVCREWEAAAEPAAAAGIRLVHARLGIVLSRSGGALAKMLTPFRMGAGGVIGDGLQYMSWIALDDTVAAIQHALTTDSLHGPVNVVAPNPVTNREFTKTLGRVLRRPTLLPIPGFGARLVLGEMADALLLASVRAEPTCLLKTGFRFRFPELESALRHAVGTR
jgi:uncharacterized protein (TIGR01777 family)